MKISYISLYNASDIHNWSGLGYYMSKALKDEGAELDYIGNLNVEVPKIIKAKKLMYKVFKKKFLYEKTLTYVHEFAKKSYPLIKADSNFIFSPGSTALSFIDSNIPKVFYTDATFAGMVDFYKDFTNLSKEGIAQGHLIEQNALDSCHLAIYSSDWAARTAIEHYKVNPEKVKVIPFGANIESIRTLGDIERIVSLKPQNECNLLFIGVDWHRKGGDLAVKVAEELNANGLKTNLHVVGIKNLDRKSLPDFVKDYGFLSKATAEGRLKLDQLFTDSHFLIVPSRAEAFGLVFCEASSFGLPSLASNVGGIPAAVRNGLNGMTFDLSATEKEYASFILNNFHNYAEYKKLAFSSFNEFDQHLNWRVAGKSLMNLLKSVQ